MVAIALLMLTGCTSDTPADSLPDLTAPTLPPVITPAPAAGGTLVVESADGSVMLVDPVDGASQTIHAGTGGGAVVQPTGARGGDAVIWTSSVDQPVVSLWRDGETQTFEAPFVPFFFDFAPDDSQVAMLGNLGSEVGLAVLDFGVGRIEAIDRGAPYFLDWKPSASGFGAHIGTEFVGSVGLDGSRSPLDGDHGVYQAPDWIDEDRLVTVLQPDIVAGARLQSISTTGLAGGAISSIDVTTGEVQRFQEVVGPVAFQVAPDGARLAFVASDDASSDSFVGPLSVIALDTGRTELVSEGPVVAFEWSPTGDRLLFSIADTEAGLVGPHVWDGQATTGYEGYVPTLLYLGQYLPFWNQYVRALTTWSPEGTEFAYAGAGAERGEIWIQPLEGERRKIADGEFVSWIGRPSGASGTAIP